MNRRALRDIFIALIIISTAIGSLALIKSSGTSAIAQNHKSFTNKLEVPKICDKRSNVIVEYKGFTLSHNTRHCIPDFVAYELTAQEVYGEVPRAKHFKQDPNLRARQAHTDDYRNSGWDRGHLAPAADMKWSEQAMRESFYLTNIAPQNPNINRGDWNDLEDVCRRLAAKYGRLYIVCGCIVGENRYGSIGANRVTVPDAFYKVLLVKVRNRHEGIGFIFENKAGGHPLRYYARTIDEVERIANIDFYPTLPDHIETSVESQINIHLWQLD